MSGRAVAPKPSEKKPVPMLRTNMYFTVPQMDKLAALSVSTGLSIAEHVRRAVDEYLAAQRVS